MNKPRLISISLLCLLTSGCMVGPNFKEPQATMPEKWQGETADQTTAVDLSRWWTKFDDKTLDSLIERAFKGNLDLAMARSRILQARYTLGMTQSGLYPSVDAEAGVPTSQNGSGPVTTAYGLGAAASWEVDVFGGVRREVQASLADYRKAQADKVAVQVALSAEVAQDYFLYRCLQQEIKITQSNLDAQKGTLEYTRKHEDVGFSSPIDLVRALADVQSTMAELPALERDLDQTRHALEYLLGLPSGALAQELAGEVPPMNLEKFLPKTGVPAALVQRRPDIMVAKYKIMAATARIGAAEADFYPHFYITGNINYNAASMNNMFSAAARSWDVGPTVTWNLFSAGKTVYNVKLQKAITQEAGLSWDAMVLNAIKEVEDSLVGISKEKVRLTTLGELVSSNRKAFEWSSTLYKEGQIEFLDLLVAQRSMLSSEQAEVLSRKDLIFYVIDLYRSLGGGWTQDDLTKDEAPKDGPVPARVNAPNG